MEIAIVEPCPECGRIPDKIKRSISYDDTDQWYAIQCRCGFKVGSQASNFYDGLRMWNEEALHRRLEKQAKPCPFCGSNELEIAMESNLLWAVTCQECEGRSGLHKTKEDALDAWNKRPDSDE